MPDSALDDTTQLLIKWSNGDREAFDKLMSSIYRELYRLAKGYLRHERPDHTLQATGLIHETFLRLVDQERVNWRNRAHFLGVAAQTMRRILVDYARRHASDKRGGGTVKILFDEMLALPAKRAPDLMALDDTLNSLATVDKEQAKIVELRFFGGMSTEEIAEVLSISTATVERRWRMVKAWLYRQLGESKADKKP